LLLSDFDENLNLLKRFSKNAQTPNFMKICPVVAKYFHADGRTDGQMTKLVVVFPHILRTRLKTTYEERAKIMKKLGNIVTA
jgi:hypothetical protein